MSKVRADKLVNRAGTGAVELTEGATLASGKYISGAGSLNITGVSTIGGNVTIGGTLTYDDVTNIDSVGIVTAGKGFRATTGGITMVGVATLGAVGASGTTVHIHGDARVTGVLTATTFSGNLEGDVGIVTSNTSRAQVGSAVTFYPTAADFNGLLREAGNVTTGKLSDNTNIDLSAGMVHTFIPSSGGETASSTPNLRYNAAISLNNSMAIGDSITVTLITVSASASYYSAQLTIDGSATTEEWLGGSAPSAGSGSGYDVYTYTIIKTADATFLPLANFSNFA